MEVVHRIALLVTIDFLNKYKKKCLQILTECDWKKNSVLLAEEQLFCSSQNLYYENPDKH